jgi:hypothetical protein
MVKSATALFLRSWREGSVATQAYFQTEVCHTAPEAERLLLANVKSGVAPEMDHANTTPPNGFKAPYRTGAPNEPVVLYKGLVKVISNWLTAENDGEIVMEWLPEPKLLVRVKAPVITGTYAIRADEESHLRVGVRWEEEWCFGEASLQRLDLRDEGVAVLRLISLNCGKGKSLAELTFHLANFAECLGAPIHFGTTVVFGRIEFFSEQWRVTIDPTPETPALLQRLKEFGGYAITHCGRLRRADGASFSSEEAETVLLALYYFLSFAAGRWTGPMLLLEADASGKRWAHWEQPPLLEPHGTNGGFSWLPATQEGKALRDAWPGFFRLWEDETWNEALRVALSWYVQATSGVFLESQFMLGQAALELLAWVKLIEHEGILSSDGFGKLPASDQLLLLLAQSGVPKEIPPSLSGLLKHAKAFNLKDGPSAIIWFRNRVVHANKLEQVTGTSVGTRVDVWKLMLWYLELVLLRLWDYQGTYHSWVAPLQPPTKVPWRP